MSNGTSFSGFYDSSAASGSVSTAFNPDSGVTSPAPAPRSAVAPAPSPAQVVAQWQRIVGTVSHQIATAPADQVKAKPQPQRMSFSQYLQTLPEEARADAIAKREADLAARQQRAKAKKGLNSFAMAVRRLV